MKILHLDASINGEQSVSRRISAHVTRALMAIHPGASLVYRDLAQTPLPHLTLAELGSEQSREALEQFQAADVVVIGTGMYNFSVPTQLKAWIDRILVAGETFRYTDARPVGLAGRKRVIVALARGGVYAEDDAAATLEHAERYLRSILAFIGVEDVEVISVDGVALPERRAAAIAAGERQAAAIGA